MPELATLDPQDRGFSRPRAVHAIFRQVRVNVTTNNLVHHVTPSSALTTTDLCLYVGGDHK